LKEGKGIGFVDVIGKLIWHKIMLNAVVIYLQDGLRDRGPPDE